MLENKCEMISKDIPHRRISVSSKLVTEDWYNKLLGECKAKAAKQKDIQIKEAKELIKRDSPASRRRGKLILKTAANLEKEAVEEFEFQLHSRLTKEAEMLCYGSTSSGKKAENVLGKKVS